MSVSLQSPAEEKTDERKPLKLKHARENTQGAKSSALYLALYMASNSVIVCAIHSLLQVKDAWYRQEC